MDLNPKINRFLRSKFLFFISRSEIQGEFDYLENFLQSHSSNFDDFFLQFLSGKPKKNKQEEKLIPKFYKQVNTPHQKQPFSNLFKADQLIDSKILGKILENRYLIPHFFGLQVMSIVNSQIVHSKQEKIMFSSLIEIGTTLDKAESPNECIFFIVIANKNRDHAIIRDFYPLIVLFIQHNPQFKSIKKNISLCSLFARFVITKLNLIYDNEFRGIITKNSFLKLDFMNVLNYVAKFDQFLVVYERFLELNASKNKFLDFTEFVRYDNCRIHPNIAERLIKYLPGPKDTRGISFGEFVAFVSLLDDKSTKSALNFWFKVCDIDEDGILSMSEMHYFYKLQKTKLKLIDTEILKFKQLIPQIMDLIGCKSILLSKSKIKESGNWATLFNFLIDPGSFSELDYIDPLYQMKSIEDGR